jgi:P27 family predicted phage terminase small subunit
VGSRGPAPAPTALKVIKGEKKSRINQKEPRPPVAPSPPRCPSWLSPQAKRVWRSLAADMHRRGVLTDWDRVAFAVFCEAVIHHRKACEMTDASALLVRGAHGALVKNPGLQIIRDQAAIIRGFAQEFGLTPSARSSIELPDTEEYSAARRLLS